MTPVPTININIIKEKTHKFTIEACFSFEVKAFWTSFNLMACSL